MALSPKRLIGATLTTSAAVYYTATEPVTTRIDTLSVCNYSASPATFSLYIVPKSGSPDTSNIVVKDRSIAAGGAGRVLEAFGQWVPPGGTIQMVASAGSAITVTASGIEQTSI
jgi:hypothetical protein